MLRLRMAFAALSTAFLFRKASQADAQLDSLFGAFGCVCCYLYNSRRSVFARALAADLHPGWQLVDDNRLPQRL